jgi:cubilin
MSGPHCFLVWWLGLLCHFVLLPRASSRVIPPLPSIVEFDCSSPPVKANSGYVHSPLYPKNYPNEADCTTTIEVAENNIVELTFYEFHTEECCDALLIYNGPTATDENLLTKLYGNMVPPDQRYRSNGTNSLTLRFISDPVTNYQGYYARFDAIPQNENHDPTDTQCPPSTYTNGYGVIVSPKWPHQYPALAVCPYSIEVEEGSVVELTVNYFQTEPCCDILAVYDGADANSPSLAK